MKFLFKLLLVLSFLLLPASGVFAYTGIYGVFPVIPGGPSSVTVTQFKLNTSSGPQQIQTNLNYVHSISIETSDPINSHILIKEYPTGSGTAFDIIVPQKVQDSLVSATITIWAPETESLVVEHDHKGAPLEYEQASKVEPIIVDEHDNILWQFTVSSFSSFTPFESLTDAMKPRSRWQHSFWYSLFPLVIISVLAPLHLRQRN